uniref:Cytochrome c oxidase polypeptide VIIc n=1 Tax=Steinernema glaseri TaxID=37863 RepID=A0A1I7XVN7_9BILA
MIGKRVVPLLQSLRRAHGGAPAQYTGQTPTSFVQDGWASARLPFNVRNRYGLAIKAVLFLASGFWAPFLVVEYQLRKANQ